MMKDLLKKLQKKSNKKGFTLVEIIVVLVILSILAAIAVPSVLGYVNEAKEERYIQEAHSIYVVIQTEEAKSEALGETTPTYGEGTVATADKAYEGTGICKKAFDMTKLQVVKIAPTTKDNKKVYALKWKSDDGKTIETDLTKNNDVKITSKD